jgi:hypothetical protein
LVQHIPASDLACPVSTTEGIVSRETIAEKARRYLCEGRVRVLECHEDDGTALIDVHGSNGSYTVTFERDHWRCDCPTRRGSCSHREAAKLITTFTPRTTS